MARIHIVSPAPAGSTLGNRVTALRWAELLRQLGHHVIITTPEVEEDADLLIALHARRSGPVLASFRETFPDRPAIVALTGTDLYRDLPDDETARRSLEIADRVVALQPHAPTMLPSNIRAKTVVILQSAVPSGNGKRGSRAWIDVALVGHLREEKDPFRGLEAQRLLPSSSRLRILHAGSALEPAMEQRARSESNDRYLWLGGIPASEARKLIASSAVMLLSSIIEGGANVLSESIVDHVPIIAANIPSTAAILGRDYPGLYPPRDTRALASLLARFEEDRSFRADLRRRVETLAPLFDPARERDAWARVLSELSLRH